MAVPGRAGDVLRGYQPAWRPASPQRPAGERFGLKTRYSPGFSRFLNFVGLLVALLLWVGVVEAKRADAPTLMTSPRRSGTGVGCGEGSGVGTFFSVALVDLDDYFQRFAFLNGIEQPFDFVHIQCLNMREYPVRTDTMHRPGGGLGTCRFDRHYRGIGARGLSRRLKNHLRADTGINCAAIPLLN